MQWDVLFRLAGLDSAAFTSAIPEWTPAWAADQYAAWRGVYPERPELPIRLEAAAFRGRLVAFKVFGPWGESGSIGFVPPLIFSVMSNSLLLFGLVLAWFNTRAGRGDRRGAFRLAVLLFVLSLVGSLLGGHHVSGREELLQVRMMVAIALFNAAFMYVAYLAIEPQVRRRWPRVLVGWSRLLAGNIRDPLIGREVLIGLALGAGLAVAQYVVYRMAALAMDFSVTLNTFVSIGRSFSVFPRAVEGAVSVALLATLLILVIRMAVRSNLATTAAMVLVTAGLGAVSGLPSNAFSWGLTGLFYAVALTRYGLLTLGTCALTGSLLVQARGGIALGSAGGVILATMAVFAAASVYIAIGRTIRAS
jgi:serine/threonine-protein kinase